MQEEPRGASPEETAAVAQAIAETEAGRFPQVIRALRNPNFRLFWSGNFLSNIGTWMQNVAQGWLVLLLTANSAFWLGVVGFAGSIPFLFFTLFGGVIADRVNKRRLLLVTQSVMMLLAFLLAALAYVHKITVWGVALIAFLNGTAMSMNAPSYQALVPRLVKREDLTNAIALNSAQFNLSRIIGPTLGGYAMALFGVAGNFFLNGVSFLAVLGALTRIRYPQEQDARRESMWASLRGGFRYVRGNPQMLVLVWLTAVVSFLGVPFITFIPFFAKAQLHAGASGLGWLLACSGAGAVLAAVTVAARGVLRHRGVVITVVGVPGVLRGIQRHPHDLFVQYIHPASVFRRDAGPRNEHLRHLLSRAAAGGRADGRRAFAAHSYEPRACPDGRHGGTDLPGDLRAFALAAGTGLKTASQQASGSVSQQIGGSTLVPDRCGT